MPAEICPVCLGKGKLPKIELTSEIKTCHGCYGRGWVETSK